MQCLTQMQNADTHVIFTVVRSALTITELLRVVIYTYFWLNK